MGGAFSSAFSSAFDTVSITVLSPPANSIILLGVGV